MQPMGIQGFDHVAIPTSQPEVLMAFYRSLGFGVPSLEAWRATGKPFFSLQFGENKINVHAPAAWQNPDFTLRGPTALPGCGDFCFVWDGALQEILDLLAAVGAPVEMGPVARLGARGGGTVTGTSVYTRDPDGNLLEFMVYDQA